MSAQIDVRKRIRIIYQDAKRSDAQLSEALADLEDQNGRDLDRIAMAEAQTASDCRERRRERLIGCANTAETAAWAALRVGAWTKFARYATEWDAYQQQLTLEGTHVESPFRALIDLARGNW
jgi:hypothetical protein